MAWEKAEDMFPYNYIPTTEGTLHIDELKRKNPDHIELNFRKLIRTAIDVEDKMIWYSDGSMQHINLYSVFPFNSEFGYRSFNIFGQAAFNKFMKNKKEKESLNTNA